MSIVYSASDTLFDYLQESTLMVLVEPAEITQAARDLADQVDRGYVAACDANQLCVESIKLYLSWDKNGPAALFLPTSYAETAIGQCRPRPAVVTV